MSKMQRTKGATFEREIANDLTESWGKKVKRNLGQARDSGDDITVAPFRIECKRRAEIAVYKWLQQCEVVCEGRYTQYQATEIPIVVARADHRDAIVIMRYADWKRIAAGELE